MSLSQCQVPKFCGWGKAVTQLSLARIHSSVCNFSEDPLSNLAWVWICAKMPLTRWVTHCFQLIRDVLDNFFNEVWRLTTTAYVVFFHLVILLQLPASYALTHFCEWIIRFCPLYDHALVWLISLINTPSWILWLNLVFSLPAPPIMQGTFSCYQLFKRTSLSIMLKLLTTAFCWPCGFY